jgi:hypothetical protein
LHCFDAEKILSDLQFFGAPPAGFCEVWMISCAMKDGSIVKLQLVDIVGGPHTDGHHNANTCLIVNQISTPHRVNSLWPSRRQDLRFSGEALVGQHDVNAAEVVSLLVDAADRGVGELVTHLLLADGRGVQAHVRGRPDLEQLLDVLLE